MLPGLEQAAGLQGCSEVPLSLSLGGHRHYGAGRAGSLRLLPARHPRQAAPCGRGVADGHRSSSLSTVTERPRYGPTRPLFPVPPLLTPLLRSLRGAPCPRSRCAASRGRPRPRCVEERERCPPSSLPESSEPDWPGSALHANEGACPVKPARGALPGGAGPQRGRVRRRGLGGEGGEGEGCGAVREPGGCRELGAGRRPRDPTRRQCEARTILSGIISVVGN